MACYCTHIIPFIRKYWRSLNLAICPKSGRNALLAKFKFGSLLHYVIAQISLYAILTIIKMAVSSTTAKSPNLNHRQYFQIYCSHNMLYKGAVWVIIHAYNVVLAT